MRVTSSKWALDRVLVALHEHQPGLWILWAPTHQDLTYSQVPLSPTHRFPMVVSHEKS